ncbi:hypothetical protein AU184_04680 [Mycolicibacterium novocastrense]|nr:hypothetical protein AU072_00965 [Mycolicibacterium novocastrense]KUH74275.1 hypothetical protein AU183_12960 [Mycolicibacterium novocastrense]KUH75266.1 hypothetical protein AU184_04680 [Mycolicibacterium novocastrense]
MYIDSDDALQVLRFYQQVERVLNALGVDHEIARVERGSLFARITAWFKDPGHKDAVNAKLLEVTQNIEQYGKTYVNKATAEADLTIANALAAAAHAAGDRDFVFWFHGFLAVRFTKPDGNQLQIMRPISPAEAAVLEKHPGLQEDPRKLLEAMDEIMALNDSVGVPEIAQ